MILQYVRKNRKKQGILVSIVEGNEVYIGWSKLCKRDKFNKNFGLGIAIGRARKPVVKVIPSMVEPLSRFLIRNKRYYKDKVFANKFIRVDQEGKVIGELEI